VERRQIGSTGIALTRVVLGCGNFGGIGSAPELFGRGESEAEAFAIMDAAWELGIRAFDTADAYGGGRSETYIGSWMAATGNRPVLTTKTFNPMAEGADHGLARERVARQIESSLERLGVDTVDLYLAHEHDPATPIAETIAAFESLVDGGAVRAYGVSNFDAGQLADAVAAGRPGLVQNSYSLLERRDEDELMDVCRTNGIAYEAFSPLAGGWLTGKYRRGAQPPAGSRMTQRPEPYERYRTDRVHDALETFAARARERGVEPAVLAFAWLFAQPDVTAVVAGPRRPEQLRAPVAGLELELRRAEADGIAALFA
jgi:aryl-alcohol dehydrogenase-like predicted oxidoreductase